MLSKLINSNRIKFSVLEKIFKMPGKKGGTINIHIDLHSILADLYKANNYAETNWLENDNSMTISSSIINMAAHYRLFFHRYLRRSTRIFFYFAKNKPRNNAEYYQDYGYKFFDKYSSANDSFAPVNIEVSTNLKLVKTIAEYLPGIFYIECKNIEPSVAAGHMIQSHSGGNIVLTKDDFWFQCINMPRTVVLRLKRDDSYIVRDSNIYEVLLRKKQYECKYVPAEMLSVVYTFGGIKSRDVKGLQNYGYVKIIKILDMALERGLIPPKYTNIKNILDEIYTGEHVKFLVDTFRAIDLRYQIDELTVAQKEWLNDCLTYKYNRKDLLALNQTHYTGDNSLMLDELFRGVETFDKFSW